MREILKVHQNRILLNLLEVLIITIILTQKMDFLQDGEKIIKMIQSTVHMDLNY